MRLRRSDSSAPGISRLRVGRGFGYRDATGAKLRDAASLDRISGLVIPPAWTDVWISPHPNGHIQATGIDDAGRTQYLYHPAWRAQKDRIKFDRMLELASALPAARRRVTSELRGEEPSRERALATAFRLLDTGSLRVGSERYAEANGSYGLSTLVCEYATVSGDEVSLSFPAKSGQEWDSVIRDADLARVVRGLKRRGPHARLLAFRDERGWHPIDAAEINEYVRERTRGDFTAKDFRTLHGSVTAAVSLAKAGPRSSSSARARVVAQAMRDTAEVLGNTAAVARKSYVDPRIIDHYDRGRTINPQRLESAESELRLLLVE